MAPNVLFVTHGKKHKWDNPGYTLLDDVKRSWLKRATYVDIDPWCKPSIVMDVTQNNMDSFEKQFDYIFCMYTPYYVLLSKQFWYNVNAWLKPGGIVHTVVPRKISKKYNDDLLAIVIQRMTGLRMADKEKYMSGHGPSMVLKKTQYKDNVTYFQ